jgi:hypothetical protein
MTIGHVFRLAKDSLINRVEAEREIQYRMSPMDAQFSEFWRFLTANALQQKYSVNYQYFPRVKALYSTVHLSFSVSMPDENIISLTCLQVWKSYCLHIRHRTVQKHLAPQTFLETRSGSSSQSIN